MKYIWTGILLFLLPVFSAAEKANNNSTPSLINTCLITKNVSQLTEFYQRVLQIAPTQVSKQYAEFHTGVGVLALFSAEAQEKYIPRSATAGENRSSILEFEVADVDREFQRLQA